MEPKKQAALMLIEFMPIVLEQKKAKECALIAVDKILNNAVRYNAYDGVMGSDIWIDIEYWLEVKQEIEKL